MWCVWWCVWWWIGGGFGVEFDGFVLEFIVFCWLSKVPCKERVAKKGAIQGCFFKFFFSIFLFILNNLNVFVCDVEVKVNQNKLNLLRFLSISLLICYIFSKVQNGAI